MGGVVWARTPGLRLRDVGTLASGRALGTHSIAESVRTCILLTPEQGAVVSGGPTPGSVEIIGHETDEIQVSGEEGQSGKLKKPLAAHPRPQQDMSWGRRQLMRKLLSQVPAFPVSTTLAAGPPTTGHKGTWGESGSLYPGPTCVWEPASIPPAAPLQDKLTDSNMGSC